MTDLVALAARIERLEALDEIRQLVAKYALALDMRDFDALVNLFVEDVGAPEGQRGRAALKRWYHDTMRPASLGTAHGVSGHIIDFESEDLATGIVYSRNDLETADTWLMVMMSYLDRYERHARRWYFQRRTPLYWYVCDVTDPPVGENKLRWPGRERSEGAFHEPFPSWQAFWDDPEHGDRPVVPPAPLYRFLAAMRRGTDTPRVDPAGGAVTDRSADPR